MGEQESKEHMLSPYRVLDLTDEKGLLCGKLLGDLGADVIKIEKPGGDPSRNIGPFYHDDFNLEKSLFWFAFNTSKRGVTLDIETPDGQEIFKKLTEGADFIIESFPPGYMNSLGLGYAALEEVNPGVIMVSISPFGQVGPYKDYKASDIVAWAMGGEMYLFGDADRPPIRISHHSQAYLHAAAEAAVGALVALSYRELTREGQQVDVSIQEAVAGMAEWANVRWDASKLIVQRGGSFTGGALMRRMWPCKDGYVCWHFWGGQNANRWMQPIIAWMDSEGMADDFLKGLDWDTFDLRTATQEMVDTIGESPARFFMAHTKAELLEGAIKHNAMLYPVSTTSDIFENAQLAARGYWIDVDHPELGTAITYPGAFAHASESPPKILRRAPLIGEHNQEIYGGDLGLTKEQLTKLKQAKVI